MAQPNLNQIGKGYGPLANGAGTPFSNWDSLFYNRLTKNNPLAPNRASQPPGQQNDKNGTFGDPSGAPGVAGPTGAPSLEMMANGGATHAQMWSQPYKPVQTTPNPLAGTGFETGNPQDIANKYGNGTMGAVGPQKTPGYGWNSAFTSSGDEEE